jgi:hypothetical protein
MRNVITIVHGANFWIVSEMADQHGLVERACHGGGDASLRYW